MTHVASPNSPELHKAFCSPDNLGIIVVGFTSGSRQDAGFLLPKQSPLLEGQHHSRDTYPEIEY